MNKINLFTERTATNENSWCVHAHAATKQQYGTFLHSSITNKLIMIYSLQLQNHDDIIVYNTYVNKISLFTKRTATNETYWRVYAHGTVCKVLMLTNKS